MSLPEYRELFGIEISKESSARDNFKIMYNNKVLGAIKAFGAKGAVVGQDGGMPRMDRFTGAILMDDMHKPDEVHSDTIRESVIKNYEETIMQRQRSPAVPFICIGQRLHDDDLPAHLIDKKDGYDWKKVILKARDEVGNSIHPTIYPLSKISISETHQPYVFSSQYQQEPTPAGGALFKRDYFVLLEEDPEIIATFIIGDTAETDKTWNDATAFSFFGIYRIKEAGVELDQYALHWLDCWEEWVEPKDLKQLFLDFYANCMRYRVKPTIAAIEKKSTGTALLSSLSDFRGLRIVDICRNEIGKSKTQRFVDSQDYIASKLISLPTYGKHTQKCIDHMAKITANNTHKRDDIADTCADAIKLALVDKTIIAHASFNDESAQILKTIAAGARQYQTLRSNLWSQ